MSRPRRASPGAGALSYATTRRIDGVRERRGEGDPPAERVTRARRPVRPPRAASASATAARSSSSRSIGYGRRRRPSRRGPAGPCANTRRSVASIRRDAPATSGGPRSSRGRGARAPGPAPPANTAIGVPSRDEDDQRGLIPERRDHPASVASRRWRPERVTPWTVAGGVLGLADRGPRQGVSSRHLELPSRAHAEAVEEPGLGCPPARVLPRLGGGGLERRRRRPCRAREHAGCKRMARSRGLRSIAAGTGLVVACGSSCGPGLGPGVPLRARRSARSGSWWDCQSLPGPASRCA